MPVHGDRASVRALLIAIVMTLALPVSALAADGLATRTESTFKLLPGRDRIKVDVNVSITNRQAPRITTGPCSPGSAQLCRFRQSFYADRWGYIYIPPGAVNIKFSPGVNKRLDKQTKFWKQFLVTFPNLFYNQTRRFKVSYELAGGRPRSVHNTRVMDAYTYFCWHGEPADTGKVTAQLPAGYEATTFGEKTRTKSNRKGTTITAVFKGSPGRFYACTDAFKPKRLLTTEVTSPGGQRVTIEGWPEDPDWSESMVEVVEETLPELEALVGRSMPIDEIVIREVTKGSLGGYGSQFGVRRALVRLGEHIDNPTSAPRALSMAWFNDRKIKDDWLQHGLTGWAGNTVGSFGCWDLGEFPGKGRPNLAKWKRLRSKPTEAQEAVVDWQFDAACNVVEQIAERVGEDRMREVIAALLDGTSKYRPEPGVRQGKPKPATWKDWLDAVDEVGLMPAGETDLSMAEQALRDIGVANGRTLKGRAGTRAKYHETLAGMDGTHMPLLVTNAMDRWDFKTARQSMPIASAAYSAIMANEAMSEADRADFLARFEAARTAKALRALKGEATSFVPPEPESAMTKDSTTPADEDTAA